jgi:hypothetical protein
MNIQRISAVVILLVGLAVPANAGSVTYDFIETGGGSLTGDVGVYFVFNSPPASATAQWGTDNLADILNFQVLDPDLSTPGAPTPLLDIAVESFTGASLDSGIFHALNSDGITLTAFFNGQESVISAIGAPVFGAWSVAPVPEPSTFVLSSIAMIAVFGVCARRRTGV